MQVPLLLAGFAAASGTASPQVLSRIELAGNQQTSSDGVALTEQSASPRERASRDLEARLKEVCKDMPPAEFARLIADITAIKLGHLERAARPPQALDHRRGLASALGSIPHLKHGSIVPKESERAAGRVEAPPQREAEL
jgi:hypothetical protein